MAKLIIDVSEHQGFINWEAIKLNIDGVIIRCGFGDDDTEQDDKRWKHNVTQCEKLGIPYGVYLYSYANTDAHAKSEAAHTLRLLKGHKPQYPVYIDLEESAYGGYAVKCADIFCKVMKKAGYTPGVYTFESFYNSFMSGYDKYTLWIAKYGANDGKPHDKPNISKPYDAWQFSSNYYVKGFGSRLDVSYFYKDFEKSDAKPSGDSSTPAKALNRGQVAADIHKRMVQDERFGYSWEERYGAKSEKWTVDGLVFSIMVGDYDCSSSTITAWRKALTGTKYANALDGATYTGNMRSVFVGSGLFTWKPPSFIASPGDLYLNEANHVAMCQQQVPDELSEFSWGDNGAYGNKRGDQSGFESRVNPYYDYPWDGILHYDGKADTPIPEPQPEPKPATRTFRVVVDELNVRAQPSTSAKVTNTFKRGKTVKADRVVVKNGYRWASWVNGKGNRRYAAIRTQDKSERYMKRIS